MTESSAIVITRDTLRALGIKHLLGSLFNIKAQVAQGVSPLVAEGGMEQYEIIFVDEYNCLSHLDLFIPQKNKTVILANTDEDKYLSWQHINCNTDEDRIVEAIAAILKKLRHSNSTQSGLSSREIEVLKLVAQGMTNKEIADNLTISINTVLSHRKNISAKLGIKSVSGLCIYAMMNGIVH